MKHSPFFYLSAFVVATMIFLVHDHVRASRTEITEFCSKYGWLKETPQELQTYSDKFWLERQKYISLGLGYNFHYTLTTQKERTDIFRHRVNGCE